MLSVSIQMWIICYVSIGRKDKVLLLGKDLRYILEKTVEMNWKMNKR